MAMAMARSDNNRVYLYRHGDECKSITGGWAQGEISLTKTEDSMYTTVLSNGKVFAETINSVKTKKYLYMKLKRNSIRNNLSYSFGFKINEKGYIKNLGLDENLNIILRATVDEAEGVIDLYSRYYDNTQVYEIWTTDAEDDFENGYIQIIV